jgi:hypothetical protein
MRVLGQCIRDVIESYYERQKAIMPGAPQRTAVMSDAAVSDAELLALLANSAKCAELARDNMRFDFFNAQQRVCVGLLCTIIEYAGAIHAVVSNGMTFAPTTMHRAALDSLVDMILVCADLNYCENLELADAVPWLRMLGIASAGKNPLLKAIAESESFEQGRSMYAERVRILKRSQVRLYTQKERYERANMSHEYEAAYSMLSAEAHSNSSFIVNHFFDLSMDLPRLRAAGERSGTGSPLATLLNMSEILINASDLTLGICGHGIAMMAPARSELERVHTILLRAVSTQGEDRAADDASVV